MRLLSYSTDLQTTPTVPYDKRGPPEGARKDKNVVRPVAKAVAERAPPPTQTHGSVAAPHAPESSSTSATALASTSAPDAPESSSTAHSSASAPKAPEKLATLPSTLGLVGDTRMAPPSPPAATTENVQMELSDTSGASGEASGQGPAAHSEDIGKGAPDSAHPPSTKEGVLAHLGVT